MMIRLQNHRLPEIRKVALQKEEATQNYADRNFTNCTFHVIIIIG